MLIKPLNNRQFKPEEISLPNEVNRVILHPAYFGTRQENISSLENDGEILTLPIMYQIFNVRNNKRIHDKVNPFSCLQEWPRCQCQFAKRIRGLDLGLSLSAIDRLWEIL